MREIKFRGKRKDNGEWVYGDLLRQRNKLSTESAIIYFEGEYIIPNSPAIIPETIGQFTGLHDKNGKEIYEGDIVKIYNISAVIKWNNQTASFFGYGRNEDGDIETTHLGFFEKTEVIGNVFDSPDLKEVFHEA